MTGNRHPWEAFLEARLGVIQWLRDDGQNEEYILHAIGCDPLQLRCLIMTLDDREAEAKWGGLGVIAKAYETALRSAAKSPRPPTKRMR